MDKCQHIRAQCIVEAPEDKVEKTKDKVVYN